MNFFPHIQLEDELRELIRLRLLGLAFAYHADADGVISAALLAQLPGSQVDGFAKVRTEQLSLGELSRWARHARVRNLATLDINVWSTTTGLSLLASSVDAVLLVIDDHLGRVGDLPERVRVISLLPDGPRLNRRDQIRPTFLFADAIVNLHQGRRGGYNSFLTLSGTYGEGVDHLFELSDIFPTQVTKDLARKFGRGLTSMLLLDETDPGDDLVVRALIDLALEAPTAETVDEAARRSTDSAIGEQLFRASATVSGLVREEAHRVDTSAPWLSTEKLNVFVVEVSSSSRIANLVASEARNRIHAGVTIALQERPDGTVVELRRTRNLNEPDLAQLLLDMDSSLFASRGGHPMAAGATVIRGKRDDFLRELRDRMGSVSVSQRS